MFSIAFLHFFLTYNSEESECFAGGELPSNELALRDKRLQRLLRFFSCSSKSSRTQISDIIDSIQFAHQLGPTFLSNETESHFNFKVEIQASSWSSVVTFFEWPHRKTKLSLIELRIIFPIYSTQSSFYFARKSYLLSSRTKGQFSIFKHSFFPLFSVYGNL